MRFACGSPCCRHKPFGVIAILVWMSLMSVISILYAGHYWPATLVHAGLCLSLHCIVRVNDPMHVCSLLFCVCWVWYYTYSVEYYSFTYAMLLVCSIVPCPAVSRILYGIWAFHSSRIFLSICMFLRSIASMKNIILVLLFTMFVYGIARVIVSMRLLLFPSTFWFVYRQLLWLIRTCAF